MQKVKDHLNLDPRKIKTGEIGIEVEVEGRSLGAPPSSSVWKGTQDTSLRGESLEYVLKEPLSVKAALSSINELDKIFKGNGTVVYDSIRAGVHVHKNVQEYNIIRLYNLIVAWLIFDEVMASFAGETREGNLFCLRATDAEYLISMLKHAAEENDLRCLTTDEIRYASINLAALGKFGSVEFRLMRTPTDILLVHDWVELLLKIIDFADSFSTPQHIVTSFSEINYTNFCRSCFGDKFNLLEHIPDLSAKTKRGMRLAQEVAFNIDWNSLINPLEKNIFGAVSSDIGTNKVKPKKIGQKYIGQVVPRKGKLFTAGPASAVRPTYMPAMDGEIGLSTPTEGRSYADHVRQRLAAMAAAPTTTRPRPAPMYQWSSEPNE